MFPHLSHLAKASLTISHGIAVAERRFSVNTAILRWKHSIHWGKWLWSAVQMSSQLYCPQKHLSTKTCVLSKANSAFHPSGVGKWVPASAGKAKAGMVHSDSGWMRGVQVKLWDPLRTRAIPERLRGAFTTRRYTNPRLPLPLPYMIHRSSCHII